MAEKTEAERIGAALRPRERKFVQEYLKDMNGTKAAIRAGYGARSAASQASRMLRRAAVQEYRDALLQEAFESIGVTKHSLAAETWDVYRRCCQKEPVLEWDSEAREWVESGEWKFDAKGALRALALLCDMLPDVRETEEQTGGSIEDLLSGGEREF